MHFKKENRREFWAATFLVIAVAALSYLILAARLGFYGDDWYLVYAGSTEGWRKFFEIFASDRPFRAYFVGLVFQLFGLNAPLYAYLSYALRVMEALGAFWLIRLVWPNQKRMAVLLSVLFIVYPGWSDQPAAFDYQSHLLAFALEIFSLVLSIHALSARNRIKKALLIFAAVLSEIVCCLLMEYYIGIEGLRFLIFFYMLSGSDLKQTFSSLRHFITQLINALKVDLPYIFGAAAFLFWRSFLFNGSREATNLGSVFSSLAGDPIMRGLWSLVLLVQDFFNVTVFGWFVPVYQTAYQLRLRDALIAIGLGLLAVMLVLTVWLWLKKTQPIPQPPEPVRLNDGTSMLIIGGLGVLCSLVPVILGDRHIVFPTFARFTLTGSISAIIALGGLLTLIQKESVRLLIALTLIGLAVMGHYGNTMNYAEAWTEMKDFWWQVSWRAPQISEDTVLVADYANAGIPEDYLVWGPANLIYYPQMNRPDGKTTTPLGAVVVNPQTVQDIQMGRSLSERERRSITSPQDLTKVLVMTMPTEGSCVHIIDGKQPELSHQEQESTYLIASASQTDRIEVNAAPQRPPESLFGSEPAHNWCYYYQKASLARQQGNWEEVARLGDEAQLQDLHPLDWVEWMPFYQAYAYLGRYDAADQLATILSDIPYIKHEACELFTQDGHHYGSQFPQAQQYMLQTFCQ